MGEGGRGAYIGESFTSIGFELHLLLEEPVKDVRPGMRQEKNHLDGVGETYSAAVWDVSDRCEKLSDRGLPSGCWGGADSIAMGFSLGRATYVTSLSAGLDAMAIAMVLVIRVRLNSRGPVASDALRMPGDSGVTLTPRCLFHSAQALQALKDFAGQTRLLALLRDATPGNQGLSPPVSNPPPNFSSPQLQASPQLSPNNPSSQQRLQAIRRPAQPSQTQ